MSPAKSSFLTEKALNDSLQHLHFVRMSQAKRPFWGIRLRLTEEQPRAPPSASPPVDKYFPPGLHQRPSRDPSSLSALPAIRQRRAAWNP
eukprot:3760760-Pyramimonas_sp.AAC.1